MDTSTSWPPYATESSALLRAFDWSQTSLGPLPAWPGALRTVVDLVLNSPVAMVLMWGPDHRMIYNDGYAPIAGARHPAAFGGRVDTIWPEIWDWNRRILEAGLRGEVLTYRGQHLVLRRNGPPEDVWFDLYYTPVHLQPGHVGGVLCTVVETTRQVLAARQQQAIEEELRRVNRLLYQEREAVRNTNLQLLAERGFLRELFEQAPGFMAVLRGPEHVFELANPPYRQLVGGREVVGKTVREALPELQGDVFYELLDRVYRSGQPYVGKQVKVTLYTAPSGALRERVLNFVYQPIRAEDGSVIGIFVEGTDVTEQTAADERLRVAQRAGGIGTFEWFPDSGRLEVSDEYRRIWGLPPDVEVTEALLLQVLHPDDRRSAASGRPHTGNPLEYAEYRVIRPSDGQLRWIARRGEVLQGGERSPPRYLGACFDITERKTVEAELRDSNERLSALFNQAAAGICQADLAGTIEIVNQRFCEILGRPREDVVGRNLLDLTHAEDQPRNVELFERLVREGVAFLIDKRYLRPDGTPVWVSKHASLVRDLRRGVHYISATVVDINERRRVEDQLRLLNETLEQRVASEVAQRASAEEALRQAQKMEAVGLLTGGIAHDFNNLLQGIVGSLDLVQLHISRGRVSEIDRFVASAMTAANRAAALTHRLLAFARRQPLDPRPVRANQLIASMEELLRRSLGVAIEMELVLAGGLWMTRCDPNQLENAILNLAINARDAMPHGGQLTIETCNAHIDEAYASQQREAIPGQYVCISVSDTGVGMTSEVMSRAFDPFFTTKPIGQGTGLGLSMIYGFARQSEGFAKLYSEPQHGTTVKLYLPRYRGAEAAADEPAAAPPSAALAHGAETVLVAEDERIVRNQLVEVLQGHGYHVLEAADGTAALAILDSPASIDLLLTDIGLPGLNGRQVADAGRLRRPQLKVLFMTGYAENAAVANGFLEPGMEMVTKPFALERVLQRVRALLDRSSAAAR